MIFWANPRLKDLRGMETSVSTTAATMPVSAPTMAPSPEVRAAGVSFARSFTAAAAPPTIQRQQRQLAEPMNGRPDRNPATAPAMRAGLKYSGFRWSMSPPGSPGPILCFSGPV